MRKLYSNLICIVLICISVYAGPQDGSVLVPGPSLYTEGIPPIPISLDIALDKYRLSYGYPLSRWGAIQHELYLKILANQGTWLSKVVTPGRPSSPFISIPTGNVYEVYLQPQGQYVLYNKDHQGDEKFQFYLYDVRNRTNTTITTGNSRNTEPVWSNDGRWVVYSSSAPGSDGVDLSLIDPFDPSTNRVLMGGKGHYLKAFDWSPDNNAIAFCEFYSNTTSALWVIDWKNRSPRRISSTSPQIAEYFDSPQFSKDGLGIFVITDRQSEYRRLSYIDLKSSRVRYLTESIKWDVEEFRAAPDGKTIAFVTNEDGVSRLYLLDVISRRISRIENLPIGLISCLQWDASSSDVGFNFTSSRVVNDVLVVNIRTQHIEVWSKSVVPNSALEAMPEPQIVKWKSFDGTELSAFVYRPKTLVSVPRPVIIDIHGGPEDQYRPRFNGEDAYFLNELGIVKIYPNIRGSTGYGKKFVNMDNGHLRNNAVRDIGALLDWIKSQPDLDPQRVLVQGVSYGGFVALSVSVQYSDRICAALSDSGPLNLVTLLENTANWRQGLRREEYGNEFLPAMRAYLERSAPMNNAARITKPVMLINGGNDARVPAQQCEQFATQLKNQGIPVWYLQARNEGHNWSQERNWRFRSSAAALFAVRYLLR